MSLSGAVRIARGTAAAERRAGSRLRRVLHFWRAFDSCRLPVAVATGAGVLLGLMRK